MFGDNFHIEKFKRFWSKVKIRRGQQLKDSSIIDGELDSSTITQFFRTNFTSNNVEEEYYNVDSLIPKSCSTEVVLKHDVKYAVSK